MNPRSLAVAAGALGLLTLGFAWFSSSDEDPAQASARAAAEVSARATRDANLHDEGERQASPTGVVRGSAAAAAPAPDPKLALLEASQLPPADEAIDFDAPRPGPDAEVWAHESDREAELHPATKAEQAWSMRANIQTRVQTLRERLSEAEAEGDSAEVERLEQIVSRLEQRGAVLEREAADFDAQAAQAQAMDDPAAPQQDHEHAHEHAHESL